MPVSRPSASYDRVVTTPFASVIEVGWPRAG
jgi:hypothetical protein